MWSDRKRDMVYELLELLKSNKLNNVQRKRIYELVKKMDNRTENQKEKFLRFYNLLEGEKQNYRFCDMAKYYHCSPGNIRYSVNRIRHSLVNSTDETIAIIQNILEEYNNKK